MEPAGRNEPIQRPTNEATPVDELRKSARNCRFDAMAEGLNIDPKPVLFLHFGEDEI